MSGRILGIDHGDRRTGIAVSDPSGKIALGITTVEANGDRALIGLIKPYIESYGVTLIVVGYPVNMDGSAGSRAALIETFADKLEAKTGIPVELSDERCSTLNAHAILNETDTRGKNRKAVIDTLSAEIILQNYLDRTENG